MQLSLPRPKLPLLRAISHLRSSDSAAGPNGRRSRRLPPARSPLWPALIGGTLVLFTFVILSQQTGGPVTYTATCSPAEVTYINSIRPDTKSGHAASLQLDTHPSTDGAHHG